MPDRGLRPNINEARWSWASPARMPALEAVPHTGSFVIDLRDAGGPAFVNLLTHERHNLPPVESAQWAVEFDQDGMAFAFCIGHEENQLRPLHSADLFDHEVFATDSGEHVVVSAGKKVVVERGAFLSAHSFAEVSFLTGPTRSQKTFGTAHFPKGFGGGHWRWNFLDIYKVMGWKHGRKTTGLPGRFVASSWPSWARRAAELELDGGLLKAAGASGKEDGADALNDVMASGSLG